MTPQDFFVADKAASFGWLRLISRWLEGEAEEVALEVIVLGAGVVNLKAGGKEVVERMRIVWRYGSEDM